MTEMRNCARSFMTDVFFPGEAVLHFADGTMARHTAVLGCDGIKSRTRAIVLGDSDAASAVFSSKYAYRGLILMAKAIEIMGDVDPNKSQLFLGYHGHVLTFPIAHATLLNGASHSDSHSHSSI